MRMMYKVEYLNESIGWIYGGCYKNIENAEVNAEVKTQSGYKSRIIQNGKVIKEYAPV